MEEVIKFRERKKDSSKKTVLFVSLRFFSEKKTENNKRSNVICTVYCVLFYDTDTDTVT